LSIHAGIQVIQVIQVTRHGVSLLRVACPVVDVRVVFVNGSSLAVYYIVVGIIAGYYPVAVCVSSDGIGLHVQEIHTPYTPLVSSCLD
jgi:hypothetical protein